MEQKKWTKPKLIILTRGKPEESVLASCKNDSVAAMSATVYSKCCSVLGDGITCAQICFTRLPS